VMFITARVASLRMRDGSSSQREPVMKRASAAVIPP
jgi:hypothetical protein